ncbi:MAG: 16S rRNA (guanine(966)-N(2))-methyltransferase RsmD [Verrucomicrobia bacterium]|nr:16S rRNA (guanine(966)-N(2))-methyltransferase RsmD [Verrucomicrobiota bacterium]
MRIISGSARGIPLRIPSHDLRPTMEMVRGAIFSALGERVIDARVLDLFSGSGAFGIEALSRGAVATTFVDNHPKAIAAIKANLEKTRLEAAIVRSDVFRFLERTDQTFHLIFADPPYSKRPNDPDLAAKLITSITLKNHLVDNGLLVLEKTSGDLPVESHGWTIIRDKTYGSTQVLFLTASRTIEDTCKADGAA